MHRRTWVAPRSTLTVTSDRRSGIQSLLCALVTLTSLCLTAPSWAAGPAPGVPVEPLHVAPPGVVHVPTDGEVPAAQGSAADGGSSAASLEIQAAGPAPDASDGALDALLVPWPSDSADLPPWRQPALYAGLLTGLRVTEPDPSVGSRSRSALLDLELHAFPDRWAPVARPAPSYRVDTSVAQKGSFGVADVVWNRIGLRSTRVDLNTGGQFTFFGDLVHPAQQLLYAPDWDARDTGPPQALNIGFTQAGQWQAGQRWEYGVQYRSLDPRFEKFAGPDLKKDQAGSEAWLGWRAGSFRLRGFASQTWNNLAEDPTKDRTTELLGGVRGELELPLNTTANVSYAQGSADRSRSFLTASQRRRLGEPTSASTSSLEKVTAGMYHWADTWELSASSSYSPQRDINSPDQETLSLSHDLSLTFRPTHKIGSTMAMSVWQDREQWTGYRTEGSTASLSLWYGPFLDGHTLDFWGSYTRGRSNDGSWDTHSGSASATLSRRLGRTRLGEASVSMELGYNFYADTNYPTGNSDELYARIVFKFVEF
jgi:hypothetical protein